jgi:hypothetical protein
MEARRWGAVVTATDDFRWGLQRTYALSGRFAYTGSAFMPRTGWRVRPRFLYTPLRPGQGE